MSSLPATAAADLAIPHVWRGRELARAQERVVATGHAALDAQLPGGGWPVGCLVEVLQAQPQQHVWRLVAGGVAQCMQAQPGPMVLVQPPHAPFGPGLQAQGLPPQRVLWVRADQPAACLWATEQALRCADVVAVLAWLPRARSEDLRRLHLCAQQHDRLLFVFRGVAARTQASPARLRLLVEGADRLAVRILKRRGPPLLQPLELAAQPPRLAALLAARKGRRGVAGPVPEVAGLASVLAGPAPARAGSAAEIAGPAMATGGSHGLDRTAALAG